MYRMVAATPLPRKAFRPAAYRADVNDVREAGIEPVVEW